MNTKSAIVALILSAAVMNSLAAQDTVAAAGPADTLVVLWSSGDPEVAEKACLMYTSYAKSRGWFKEVILLAWGPSERLMAENTMVKEKVAAMQKDGVIVQACVV
ncbi:MAG TPA: hypothetical protein VMV74_11110 [Bacteroidales bacterium]|nr:hypothetical protein [Bacteroidales bacterium]